MPERDVPNELTTLKTAMQKDVEISRMSRVERKSQWIQVSEIVAVIKLKLNYVQ
jgi:hypothetical protein